MEKMYNIKIERASVENKVGNKQQIKPIKQLTQNILYWENQEMLVGNLYKDIYNETKPQIIAVLSLLSDLDLFKLSKESEEENNLLLCDICYEILRKRLESLSLEQILDNFVNKDIGLINHNRCISFLLNILHRKIKNLNDEELSNVQQYFDDVSKNSIKEYAELGHQKLSVDEYGAVRNKSIEEKQKVLEKVEKKQKIAQHKLFQHYFYKRVYEYANEISIEKSKKTL